MRFPRGRTEEQGKSHRRRLLQSIQSISSQDCCLRCSWQSAALDMYRYWLPTRKYQALSRADVETTYPSRTIEQLLQPPTRKRQRKAGSTQHRSWSDLWRTRDHLSNPVAYRPGTRFDGHRGKQPET